MRALRFAAWAVIAAGFVLLLATCVAGRDDGTSGRAPAKDGAGFDSDDVMFLQMMVPHHRQGRRIAALARDRPVQPQVRTLAAAIDTTQETEVATMAARLRVWWRPAKAPANAHAAHGGMPMTRESEIQALARMRSAGFERRFLNTLIAHQDDAIQMARKELSAGQDVTIKDLALRIARSRAAQIAQMKEYLKTAPA